MLLPLRPPYSSNGLRSVGVPKCIVYFEWCHLFLSSQYITFPFSDYCFCKHFCCQKCNCYCGCVFHVRFSAAQVSFQNSCTHLMWYNLLNPSSFLQTSPCGVKYCSQHMSRCLLRFHYLMEMGKVAITDIEAKITGMRIIILRTFAGSIQCKYILTMFSLGIPIENALVVNTRFVRRHLWNSNDQSEAFLSKWPLLVCACEVVWLCRFSFVITCSFSMHHTCLYCNSRNRSLSSHCFNHFLWQR